MSTITQKHLGVTIERIEKFLSNTYFKDVNLNESRVYTSKQIVESVWHFDSGMERISFAKVQEHQRKGQFKQLGNIREREYGPSWATHWFKIETTIPASWSGKEVHFRWNSNTEALVYENGEPRQGLTGGEGNDQRLEYVITTSASAGQRVELYIEMACNGMFGLGDNGFINPPNPMRFFKVGLCEFAVFERSTWMLFLDLQMLYDIAKALPESDPRKHHAALIANRVINIVEPLDPSTYAAGRAIASTFFQQHNGDSQHNVTAVGHCHIDTAWLWPYDETIRKCARSWATVIRYLELYPELKFTCSQAQQFDWVKTHYPSLFGRIKNAVEQFHFLPVGGTWVEMDGNIPSGEAMIRQFLYGQEFFQKEFGMRCKEFWLPDTFGYSAQLPQIMRHSGIHRFITQKLSWNLINKFPHNTFFWEGIDGSKVLTHFPPADTYCGQVLPSEVLKCSSNFKDNGRSNESLYLFGHGDGGGGPTMVMMERLRRLKNCDGIPKMEIRTIDSFFERIENEIKSNPQLLTWVGELYLELHRGTYTSQANNKRNNRRCELLLRDVELINVIAVATTPNFAFKYPSEQIDAMWKLVLLNQFHDVLPGSSIEMVYRDSDKHYAEVIETGLKLMYSAMEQIAKNNSQQGTSIGVWNTLSWERSSVISVDIGLSLADSVVTQVSADRKQKFIHVRAPAMGCVALEHSEKVTQQNSISLAPSFVSAKQNGTDGLFVLENDIIKAHIDSNGAILSLLHKPTQRESIAQYRLTSDTHLDCKSLPTPTARRGNQFVLFDDVPLFWDAWDIEVYHEEKYKRLVLSDCICKVEDNGPIRASVSFSARLTANSTIKQVISLSVEQPYLAFETEIDWQENRKCLKVEFPLAVRADSATYEIQFGQIARPTHANTSWDMAKFEVCAQRWADLSEHGFGVALLNDSKYGYSTRGDTMRLNLLRAPKAPDGNCDIGVHKFVYAIMPHEGTPQIGRVKQAASELNSPLILAQEISHAKQSGFFSVSKDAVIIEAVKVSQNDPNTIVVRLYEAFGGSVHGVVLGSTLPLTNPRFGNGLEDSIGGKLDWENNSAILSFSPFEIKTILFDLKN